MPTEAEDVPRLTGRPRTLTIWACRLLTSIAAAHLVFFPATSTGFVPDWLSGALCRPPTGRADAAGPVRQPYLVS